MPRVHLSKDSALRAWNKASFWIAYWDQFGYPKVKPRYARGAPETWWFEANKAAKIEQAK